MRSRLVTFRNIVKQLDISPVLVDIGASGGAPEFWMPISKQSIYVGFDPDLREMQDTPSKAFSRQIIVNKAVTSDPTTLDLDFVLTRSPFCSSTLEPDLKSLSNFHFHDLFVPERHASVPATTLDEVVTRTGLSRIDWLKTDTQGTDLRIFTSMSEPLKNSVLVLDVEPGLIDAYQGEDLFVDAQRHLTRNGFWLADLNVCSAVRIRQSSLKAILPDASVHYAFADRALKKAPAWCEARYFRTLEWLADMSAPKEQYGLLWIFAMMDDHLGFALDLSLEYQRRFGLTDKTGQLMWKESESQIKQLSYWATLAKVKRSLKRAVGRKA